MRFLQYFVQLLTGPHQQSTCQNISGILVPKMTDSDCPTDDNSEFDCFEKIAHFSSSLEMGSLE